MLRRAEGFRVQIMKKEDWKTNDPLTMLKCVDKWLTGGMDYEYAVVDPEDKSEPTVAKQVRRVIKQDQDQARGGLIEQALRNILENAYFSMQPEAHEKWEKGEFNVNTLRENAEKALAAKS